MLFITYTKKLIFYWALVYFSACCPFATSHRNYLLNLRENVTRDISLSRVVPIKICRLSRYTSAEV